jgi:predicted nucleic acid-binding protein
MIRVYIETSALGFYYDDKAPRERDAIRRLLGRIEKRELEGLTSEVTLEEVRAAPANLSTRLLQVVERMAIPIMPVTPEIARLAEVYLQAGVIPRTHPADAVHVAVGVVCKADVIASYNLKHLASYRAVALVNSLNRERGHPIIDIRTPEQIP